MKIKIKREGGFIGITSKANLDFDELTADEQKAFNSLAEQSLQSAKQAPNEMTQTADTNSRGFGLSPAPPVKDDGLELVEDVIPKNTQNNQMRDAFSYSVSMKKDGKTVSVKFDDMNAPPEIVEIFQKYVQY